MMIVPALAACGDGDRLPAVAPLTTRHAAQADAERTPHAGAPPQADTAEVEPPGAEPDAGVGLRLSLPADAGIDTVTYSIERDDEVLAEAVIPIAGDTGIGVQIGNLPEGDGYTLDLVVERTGQSACKGTADFAIVDGRTTDLTLTLACPGVNAGSR